MKRKLALLAVITTSVLAPAAFAQNAGVAEVETAVSSLTSELGPIVVAALGVALVGIGAVIAISLAKRLMGK